MQPDRDETNVWFERANNPALGLVERRYVLLLNSDAFVSRSGPKTSAAKAAVGTRARSAQQ